ncbi:uncharacterized protein LOC126814646 [Patella vulgata]|uniref:uncharacterized protein LOC126814646 n=1 Tax=Patella vulgata TaxID=6465 RepID=UPI00217F7344|nr:uncharacterized protein LOC126814646 [Patella vulgata]
MEGQYDEGISGLQDEVRQIKLLAKDMQLTDEEILQCAQQALGVKLQSDWEVLRRNLEIFKEESIKFLVLSKEVSTKILKKSRDESIKFYNAAKIDFDSCKHKTLLTKAGRSILIFMAIYLTAYVYHMIFDLEGPLGKTFAIVFSPYDHACMRYVRLLALPFHTMLNIGVLHNAPCLVHNPVYVEEIPENCWHCDRVNRTRIAVRNNVTMPTAALSRPTLFKNYTQEMTLTNLTDIIKNHYSDLDSPTIVVKSTVPWLKRPVDLVSVENLKDKIMETPNFHMQWISRRIMTSQILRFLFPRPKFISKISEVLIYRQIIIDGPRAKPYLVSEDSEGSIMYMQNTGNRTLDFVQKKGCEHKCNRFQTVIESGDVIIFPPIWDTYVQENGDTLSLASISYVDLR